VVWTVERLSVKSIVCTWRICFGLPLAGSMKCRISYRYRGNNLHLWTHRYRVPVIIELQINIYEDRIGCRMVFQYYHFLHVPFNDTDHCLLCGVVKIRDVGCMLQSWIYRWYHPS
jgi:hypothetical protein